MSANTQRLLNQLPTVATCLCREARVDSDDLMTSSCSLLFKNVEERAPTGVQNALSKFMVFQHIVDRELLDSNMLIVRAVLQSHFVVEITALPGNLEMGLSRVTSRFAPSVTAFLAPTHLTLFAPQSALRRPIKARVGDKVAITISQEGLQAHINADIRMRTGGRGMLGWGLGFTHKEGVPMTVRTMDKVNRLGRSLYGTMEFDFEAVPQLLGNDEVFVVLMQIAIFAVLSQLNGVPAVRLLEPREPNVRNAEFFGRQKTFERLGETVSQHLNGGSGDVFPLPLKSFFQVILGRESPLLRILLLDGCQHPIIDATRLFQALHELVVLLPIHKKAILKRSHAGILLQLIRLVKRQGCLRRSFTPWLKPGPQAAMGRNA